MMKSHLSCLIIVLSCVIQIGTYQQAIAQDRDFYPGYVITTNNDTLRGLIEVRDRSFNMENCIFKDGAGGTEKTYRPVDIKSYSIGSEGSFYSYAVDTQTKNVFLECLVLGKVSLYYFNDRYFIEANGKVQELTVSKTTVREGDKAFSRELPLYKGILQTEMNDCSTVHQNINNTTLTKKDLTQLFIDYHKCIGRNFRTFKSEAGKIKVRVGLAVGFAKSSMEINSGGDPAFTYIDSRDPMTDNTFIPSFLMEFTRAGKTNRVRIRSGLSFYSNKYHIYDENLNANLGHYLTIEYSRLEVPVLVKYYVSKRNRGLYAVAGVGLNGIIKWDDSQTVTVPPTYVLRESSDLTNNKYFTNFMGGLGFEFKLGDRPFFTEVSYGWGPLILSGDYKPSGTITGLSFSAGLLF